MQIAKRCRHALPLVLLLAAPACYVEAFTGNDASHFKGPANIPVVGVSSDGLGYSVRARDFTSDAQYGPVIQSRAIGIGTAIVGYGGGSATVEIRDAANLLIHQQAITSDLVQGSTTVRGAPPFTVTLHFRHFTGALTLGVGPADTTRSP